MIWKLIWEFSERYKLSLGRFAPFVFGKMIGVKGKKINNCMDEKLKRAESLQKQLEHATCNFRVDWLQKYRWWLDENKIPAEGEDGYPTEEVYDEKNILDFLGYIKEVGGY